MSGDKPLWLGRGIKTATFQMLRLEDLHVLNNVVIWHSKAPKCWLQILSKWAVISRSYWGEASNCNISTSPVWRLACVSSSCDMTLQGPKCWLQILSKWAVISHSYWGDASKLQHFNYTGLKTRMCFIKLWYDGPRSQSANSRFFLNEPW